MVRNPTPVSAEERERIIEALRAGESQTSVAKRFGRSSSTINRIAKEAGLEYSAPKNANEARWRFAKEGRLKLIEAGLQKALDMLPHLRKPLELQQWWMAVAVGLDKRRQEDDDGSRRVGAIAELMQKLREEVGDGDDAEPPAG